jgi:MFS family permease
MPSILPRLQVLRSLSPDGRLLFATRGARMFAYGLLAVILFFYLEAVGLDKDQIGQLLMYTLLGDTAVSLWLTTTADRLGRRRALLAGAILMILAAGLFAWTTNFWVLLVAATVGVISPSGNEVGPFLAVEQAALSQTVSAAERTGVFAWYTLVGSLATAAGSLCGGLLAQVFQDWGFTGANIYRPVIVAYGIIGLILAAVFAGLSPGVEVVPAAATDAPRSRFGLHRSRSVVLRLSGLFALDAFGGGLIVQSIVAYWFKARFDTDFAVLGAIFGAANVLAGFSALSAAWVAQRVGLLNAMVFTHLPSNVLLLLVPLMPNLPLAVLVLLLRFSISQMDVPTRQSYTVAVVSPDERSAASGVTGVARSVGAALAPRLATALLAAPGLLSVPFYLAGGIKIVYDLLLWRNFAAVKPPEEKGTS